MRDDQWFALGMIAGMLLDRFLGRIILFRRKK